MSIPETGDLGASMPGAMPSSQGQLGMPRAAESGGGVVERLEETTQRLRSMNWDRPLEMVTQQIKEYPVQSLVLGFAVGYLLAKLMPPQDRRFRSAAAAAVQTPSPASSQGPWAAAP